MALTHDELRDAVAEEMMLKSTTVALSAEDAAFISARITRTLAWLEEEGLVFWPDGKIPEAAVEPLTMIVASRCAPGFAVQYNLGELGILTLRKLAAARKSENPTAAVYF